MASEFVSDSSLYIYILRNYRIHFAHALLCYCIFTFIFMYVLEHGSRKNKIWSYFTLWRWDDQWGWQTHSRLGFVGILHKCTTPRAFSLWAVNPYLPRTTAPTQRPDWTEAKKHERHATPHRFSAQLPRSATGYTASENGPPLSNLWCHHDITKSLAICNVITSLEEPLVHQPLGYHGCFIH